MKLTSDTKHGVNAPITHSRLILLDSRLSVTCQVLSVSSQRLVGQIDKFECNLPSVEWICSESFDQIDKFECNLPSGEWIWSEHWSDL